MRTSKLIGNSFSITLLLGLVLTVFPRAGIAQDYTWMREGKWLLVYGRDGSAGNWDYVVPVLEGSPYNVPSNNIYVVSDIPKHTTLYDWTNNLVNWMDGAEMLSLPDGSVKVIAHSFGCAVTLYLLRATYELQYGDISALAQEIEDACGTFKPGNNLAQCLEIAYGLNTLGSTPSIAQKWIEAAKKIQGVYLYHPAIHGGCGACVAGETPPFDVNAASICALGTVWAPLWFPISNLTWGGCKKVVNIYGFRDYCWSACTFTKGVDDGALEDNDQCILPPNRTDSDGYTGTVVEGSYTELFGGWHCHGDFHDNSNNAPQDLVTTIVENPTPYPYGILLCGSVYDGSGGPLTNRCPYFVTCDVTVPVTQILTIQSGAQIYFTPGFKIIANGLLDAYGDSTNPIELFSENAPHHGMKLMRRLRLQNGGELKPGP